MRAPRIGCHVADPHDERAAEIGIAPVADSRCHEPTIRARSRGVVELLHEFQPHAAGRVDEDDPPRTERGAGDNLGSPHDVMAGRLLFEIVAEQRHVQEAVVGKVDVVLVDRA